MSIESYNSLNPEEVQFAGTPESSSSYESPQIMGRTLRASEANGSSSTDTPDANSQFFWGTSLLADSVEVDS